MQYIITKFYYCSIQVTIALFSDSVAIKALVEEMSLQFHEKRDSLRFAFECSIQKISSEMQLKNLIGVGTYDMQSFDELIDEFFNGLSWCQTVKELKERTNKFLEILRDVGGTLELASNHFSETWNCILDKHSPQ